ncbi:hypothetical protein LCL97_23845 [Seohaeicola saemankumensis]|nr:hypothetical protein [Seohaeicola saemankumensis]MCA0873876.1 hypothetical protein [Seohaeicola saemankumensis]
MPLFVRALPAQADGFRTQFIRSVAVRGVPLPYSAIVDVTPRGPTRLGIRVLLDLRDMQRNAPGLLSTVLDETCNQKYAVAVADAGASGSSVTLRGQFQAKLFTCNTSDPKVHFRGPLALGQNLNVAASAEAVVRGQCLHLRMTDLDADLAGLIGDIADLTGLDDKAQDLVLTRGNEVLSRHPICPELPQELAGLDPRFFGGGTTELGKGGVGAYLDGSIDVSAATLLDLVEVMIERDLLEGVD